MIIVKSNKLKVGNKEYRCAFGKKGFSANKQEGDLCSPLGTFTLRKVLYRADKIPAPKTTLPLEVISADDGWCDAPTHPQYNQQVKLPFPESHEKLWREDNLYDIVIVIGYNDEPVIPHKGSAIFMHIAKENYDGTEGCIALRMEDLLEVLESLDENTISISN